jgi:hypothetical protein
MYNIFIYTGGRGGELNQRERERGNSSNLGGKIPT